MTARDVALAAALAAAERELPLQDTLAESFEGAVLDRRDRAPTRSSSSTASPRARL